MAILKAKSPSCGTKQIYDGTFSKTLVDGQGVFTEMLQKAEIFYLDEEELEMNENI